MKLSEKNFEGFFLKRMKNPSNESSQLRVVMRGIQTQLDRVPDYESGGREFESLSVHQ